MEENKMFNLAGMDKILQLSQNFEEKEIDIGIYKRYVIAMLFYAYLSIKEEKYLNEELSEQNITFEEASKMTKYAIPWKKNPYKSWDTL